MHRLFQRAFPGFFPYNSLHLWQPFHIPAMNYVLAKDQKKLADMEDLSGMGVNSDNDAKVGTLVASMKKEAAGSEALSSQAKSLKELEENSILGYTRTEINQNKDVIKADKPDSEIQLAFKPWKRLIKMPETRFGASKATTIYVSNYSTIVDEILAKRSIYKNPGFLDYQVIPEGALRGILTGKGFDERVEGLFTRLRSKVSPDKEKVFMDYFTQQAQEYLLSGRRDYQKLKSKVEGEPEVQVWQIDIVREYVHICGLLSKGYTLICLLTCCA